MSFFGKIFGTGKKGDAAPTTGEAIQKLRETEEMLMKKQEFLEKKIDQELDIARKNAKTNKRSAIQVNDPKFWFFFNNRKNYPFLMSFAFESYIRPFLKRSVVHLKLDLVIWKPRRNFKQWYDFNF